MSNPNEGRETGNPFTRTMSLVANHAINSTGVGNYLRDNFASKAREALGRISSVGNDQTDKFVAQMLILKWAMDDNWIGPKVRAMFNTPELKPLLQIADIVGCVELSLRGMNEQKVTIFMISGNRTSQRFRGILSDAQGALDAIVSSFDNMLNRIGDPSYDAGQDFASISDRLALARDSILERSRELAMEGISCIPQSMVASMGGSTPVPRLVWHDREYVVRMDKDGKRYIMSRRARLYLAAIRGQYRYKK